jgi:hypothetical protein
MTQQVNWVAQANFEWPDMEVPPGFAGFALCAHFLALFTFANVRPYPGIKDASFVDS